VTDRRKADRIDTAHPALAQQGLIATLFFAAAIAMAGMPPLSGFLGKLLIMDAMRENAVLVWSVILITSFLMMVGFARAGSALFWKSAETSGTTPKPEPLAFTAVFALIGGLVLLTVFAGPVTVWLTDTAMHLHDRGAYIAANQLPGGN
jgi:multicomponent K+:H+ antiporter subunit D